MPQPIHSHQELIGYDNRRHHLMQTEPVHSYQELIGLDNPTPLTFFFLSFSF
jgi:hypothetical protein